MKPWTQSTLWISLMLSVALGASCSREDPGGWTGSVPESSRDLQALLPEDNAVPGWAQSREARSFDPDSLFELINGAAESYFVYGFMEAVAAEYANPQQPSPMVLELYRMKDARNAFGIYRSELNPDADFLQVGAEGYLAETALNFWAGPYYAKIVVYEDDAALRREMTQFALRLAEQIGEPGSLPPEVALLPAENQVPYSARYLPMDVLGQTYLSDAFEAKYRSGESESRLVLLSLGDRAAAGEALARYREFIAGSGEVYRDLESPGDGGFAGKDGYYGPMAALRSGDRIAIALGGPSTDFALSQAAACLQVP